MAHEDEMLYLQVARELESGQFRDGLWTKALTRALGDEALAQSLYVEWRVEQLKDVLEHGGGRCASCSAAMEVGVAACPICGHVVPTGLDLIPRAQRKGSFELCPVCGKTNPVGLQRCQWCHKPYQPS